MRRRRRATAPPHRDPLAVPVLRKAVAVVRKAATRASGRPVVAPAARNTAAAAAAAAAAGWVVATAARGHVLPLAAVVVRTHCGIRHRRLRGTKRRLRLLLLYDGGRHGRDHRRKLVPRVAGLGRGRSRRHERHGLSGRRGLVLLEVRR